MGREIRGARPGAASPFLERGRPSLSSKSSLIASRVVSGGKPDRHCPRPRRPGSPARTACPCTPTRCVCAIDGSGTGGPEPMRVDQPCPRLGDRSAAVLPIHIEATPVSPQHRTRMANPRTRGPWEGTPWRDEAKAPGPMHAAPACRGPTPLASWPLAAAGGQRFAGRAVGAGARPLGGCGGWWAAGGRRFAG